MWGNLNLNFYCKFDLLFWFVYRYNFCGVIYENGKYDSKEIMFLKYMEGWCFIIFIMFCLFEIRLSKYICIEGKLYIIWLI